MSMTQYTTDAAAEALDWFVRRRGAVTPQADKAFRAWLAAAPEHRAAYTDVERLWSGAAEAAEQPEVEAWISDVTAGLTRRRIGRRAFAAAIAASVVAVAGVGGWHLADRRALADQSFRTAVGQQATVTLPDRSVVTLNTDTIVRTRADGDRRLVYLDRGQAYFKVAKDSRHPFVVTAAGRTITALGTAFDVRVDGSGLKVVLVEGKVRVESLAPAVPSARRATGKEPESRPKAMALATEMTAGSRLVAPTDADWRVTRADTTRETSWRNGQIVITDQPLADAVAELNRYSTRKIVVDDPALAETRVSGIFRPGDMEGFARALRTSGLAQVSSVSGDEVRVVAVK